MTTILHVEREYTDTDAIREASILSPTSREKERERLQAEIEKYIAAGGKVTHVDPGVSAESKPIEPNPSQEKAAAKNRARKGVMTSALAKFREYIERRGQCTIDEMARYMKVQRAHARSVANRLKRKLIIDFDGEVITAKRAG